MTTKICSEQSNEEWRMRVLMAVIGVGGMLYGCMMTVRAESDESVVIEYEGIKPGFDGVTPTCCWLDY